MKKYAFILLVLTLLGVALTVLLFTEDEKLDQTVFAETTSSIQNLQALDKSLLVQLHASQYAEKFNNDALLDLHYEISEEFDNLRYDALFEEIEASLELSQAVGNFEANFAERELLLENYIELNSIVTRGLKNLRSSSNEITQLQLKPEQEFVFASVGRINADIFGLLGGAELSNTKLISEELEDLQGLDTADYADLFERYDSAADEVLANHSEHLQNFLSLTSLNTGPLLDAIEGEYVDYHQQAIGGSNFFRNALIAYGLALLAALIWFALQIRRNFLSLEQQVADRTVEIQTAYEDLKESQEQLIQSEKMASLGQMVAGVAHEINTPLGYVSSNIETINTNLGDLQQVIKQIEDIDSSVRSPERDTKVITQKLLDLINTSREVEANELMEESAQLLDDGGYGLSEISKLVNSLRDFARLDRQAFEQIDIHDCIESSLMIGGAQLKDSKVQVIKDYGELPKIKCIPSKLNQLCLNIISNACFAMKDTGGNLTIETTASDESITLRFSDTGVGMNEDTQHKVFDPFFTTKDPGAGTGLGMSIAYKIIEAHHGDINVSSKVNAGTTFTVSLPVTF